MEGEGGERGGGRGWRERVEGGWRERVERGVQRGIERGVERGERGEDITVLLMSHKHTLYRTSQKTEDVNRRINSTTDMAEHSSTPRYTSTYQCVK